MKTVFVIVLWLVYQALGTLRFTPWLAHFLQPTLKNMGRFAAKPKLMALFVLFLTLDKNLFNFLLVTATNKTVIPPDASRRDELNGIKKSF